MFLLYMAHSDMLPTHILSAPILLSQAYIYPQRPACNMSTMYFLNAQVTLTGATCQTYTKAALLGNMDPPASRPLVVLYLKQAVC